MIRQPKFAKVRLQKLVFKRVLICADPHKVNIFPVPFQDNLSRQQQEQVISFSPVQCAAMSYKESAFVVTRYLWTDIVPICRRGRDDITEEGNFLRRHSL